MAELLVRLFVSGKLTTAEKREKTGKLAGFFGIFCNVFLCGIKAFIGILSGSISIIADSLNNLFDALSSIVTIVCFKISGKPADKDHPYGHERIEYVATLILAFLILFVGYELVKSSLGRIFGPEYTRASILSLVILTASVAVKLIMGKTYKDFSVMINSPVLRAASSDSYNDVFSTGAVLLSAVLSYVLKISLDGYAGLFVSVVIIKSGIELIKETLDPILGGVPDRDMVTKLADKVTGYEGIIGIHDLIVHSYGPNKTFASVHAEVDANGDILDSHDIIDNIEREVNQEMGIELIIHMDPVITDDENVRKTRESILEIVSKISTELTMHDFRMVVGKTHTNLIFDVVLPFDFEHTEKEMSKLIQSEVFRSLGREYYCVINFDKNYTGF